MSKRTNGHIYERICAQCDKNVHICEREVNEESLELLDAMEIGFELTAYHKSTAMPLQG